jgi:hypothetical protein
MAKSATKSKSTGKINLTPRAAKKKKTRSPLSLDEKYTGSEPVWDGWEKWSYEKFRNEIYRGYYYYNYFNNAKDMIPSVISWMTKNGYTKEDISAYKEAPDWRTSTTMGSVATMMNNGMPDRHPNDPENERSRSEWLRTKLNPIITEGKEKLKEKVSDDSVVTSTVTIQDRVRMAAHDHMEELETWLDEFLIDASAFDAKKINVGNYFKSREINQAHARLIRDYYEPIRNEVELLVNPPKNKDDDYAQLVEGYRAYTKTELKNRLAAYDEILSACDMFLRQAKVNRKPRAKKAPSKEKLISKLKYKATDDRYKLVSIKPEECLQALEVWVFNTKTRKLGVYVSEDLQALSIKGTTIINFDPKKSVAKTVRKPEELLKGVNSLPKTKMRKLYDGIKSVETLLNGRISNDIILLKAYNS